MDTTVEDLIRRLSNFPGEMKVVINQDLSGYDAPIFGVDLFEADENSAVDRVVIS